MRTQKIPILENNGIIINRRMDERRQKDVTTKDHLKDAED